MSLKGLCDWVNQPPLITQQVRMNINKLMLLWLRNLPQYIILPLISDPRTLISSPQIKHSLPNQQLLSKRVINPFLNRKINTSIYCFLIVLLGEWIKESFSKRNVIFNWSWSVQLKYTRIVATGTGFWGCGKLNSTINLHPLDSTSPHEALIQSARYGTDTFLSKSPQSPRPIYILSKPTTSLVKLLYIINLYFIIKSLPKQSDISSIIILPIS
jgi:hypothetical protein